MRGCKLSSEKAQGRRLQCVKWFYDWPFFGVCSSTVHTACSKIKTEVRAPATLDDRALQTIQMKQWCLINIAAAMIIWLQFWLQVPSYQTNPGLSDILFVGIQQDLALVAMWFRTGCLSHYVCANNVFEKDILRVDPWQTECRLLEQSASFQRLCLR